MGRSRCCPPPCNPCCPIPFYNPCYNPCVGYSPCPPWFPPGCNPCCDDGYDSCNSCCNNKKTDFFGSTTASETTTYSSSNTPVTLTFTEVKDCACNYNNNNTFNPTCKGTYTLNVSVPVSNFVNAIDSTATATIQLKSNDVVKASATSTSATTLTINSTLCLGPCDNVTVCLVVTGGTVDIASASTRTFSGYSSRCCKTKCCC